MAEVIVSSTTEGTDEMELRCGHLGIVAQAKCLHPQLSFVPPPAPGLLLLVRMPARCREWTHTVLCALTVHDPVAQVSVCVCVRSLISCLARASARTSATETSDTFHHLSEMNALASCVCFMVAMLSVSLLQCY